MKDYGIEMSEEASQAIENKVKLLKVKDVQMKELDPNEFNLVKNLELEEEPKVEEDDDEVIELEPTNQIGCWLIKIRTNLIKKLSRGSNKKILIVLLLILYNVYLILSITYTVQNSLEMDFCNGTGFLIIITTIVYSALIYYILLKPRLKQYFLSLFVPIKNCISESRFLIAMFYILAFSAIVIFIIIDCWENPIRLRSAAGIPILIVFSILLSKHPGHIQWRTVLNGFGFQFILALLILRWTPGRTAFDCASLKVKTFLAFSYNGSDFMYGYLSSGLEIKLKEAENIVLLPIFAFKVLAIIFFFSFCINILYYIGAMQWFCIKLGWILQILLGTTAAESTNGAANIFIGQAEAPLLIAPYISKMTNSEIHAIMTSGFATIAGTVMAAYISFGISPSYLLSSSCMAAPGSLALAKIMYPETRKSKTTASSMKMDKIEKNAVNILDAAAQGAIQGGYLVASIIANLIGFIAFISFFNAVINWFGCRIGYSGLSFEWILSKLFIPFAWIIGIEYEEAEDVAYLLGIKTVVNEFIAYQKLQGMQLSKRSIAIATFSLCSFANFSSIGNQIAGLSTIAPEKRKAISKVAIRSFITGGLVSLINASIAGTLINE